jgi:hypothetical protein
MGLNDRAQNLNRGDEQEWWSKRQISARPESNPAAKVSPRTLIGIISTAESGY